MGNITDIEQVAIHLTGNMGLLFGGTCNTQIAFVDLGDVVYDGIQCRACRTGDLQGLPGFTITALHGSQRAVTACLH
ncbi:hypothetical protein D3C81_945450 [compost metagenome]